MIPRIPFSVNCIAISVAAMLLMASVGQCQSPLGILFTKAKKENNQRSVSLPSNELRLRALEDQQFLSGMANAVVFNTTAESMAVYQQIERPKFVHRQRKLQFKNAYYLPMQLPNDASQSLRKCLCDYRSFRTYPRLIKTTRIDSWHLLIVFSQGEQALKIVLDLDNAEATFYDGDELFKAEIEASAVQQIRTLLGGDS